MIALFRIASIIKSYMHGTGWLGMRYFANEFSVIIEILDYCNLSNSEPPRAFVMLSAGLGSISKQACRV